VPGPDSSRRCCLQAAVIRPSIVYADGEAAVIHGFVAAAAGLDAVRYPAGRRRCGPQCTRTTWPSCTRGRCPAHPARSTSPPPTTTSGSARSPATSRRWRSCGNGWVSWPICLPYRRSTRRRVPNPCSPANPLSPPRRCAGPHFSQ
jgi:hypothetical protein